MSTPNPIDTVGSIATATSLGSVAASTIAPHPIQIIAWIVAILSGFVAITLGCVRIRNAWNENDKR